MISSPAIGAYGTVYVGSHDSYLYAINGETGEQKWKYQTGEVVWSSPAIGLDGTVYVGSRDKKLYVINGETGEKKWEYETGGDVVSSPAIGADGTVYVGSNDNKLRAIDGETGKKKWEYETGGAVMSSPAIGLDGTVYVGSDDGEVHALATESEGLARSAWPMFGGNSQRRYNDFKDRLFVSGEPVVINYPSMSGWRLRWKKDGQLLQPNDRISGVDQAYLRIADCNEEDAGRYSVLVDDGEEQYESEEIALLPLYRLDVEVVNKEKGRVILEPVGGLYLPGQVVRVETVGFLDRWEEDLVGDKAIEEIVMNGHKKVQAYFGGYRIDAEVQPEGGGEVRTEPTANEFGLYEEGQQVLLRAIGNKERDFLGWYGEGLDRKEEELEILMDENKKVLAKFSGIPGEIQWKYETGGDVSSSPAIGEDGTVYVGAVKKVYAWDGETGNQKWEYETGGMWCLRQQ